MKENDCWSAKVQHLRSLPYGEYLRTPHWRDLRMSKFREVGRRCQICNCGRRIEIHHRTYERLGCELLSDLTVLCRDCHRIYSDFKAIGKRRVVTGGAVGSDTPEQYGRIGDSVLFDPKVSQAGKVVYACLARVWDRTGGPFVYIGQRRLAHLLGMSRATVGAALKVLSDEGHVMKIPSGVAGKGRCTYRINSPLFGGGFTPTLLRKLELVRELLRGRG